MSDNTNSDFDALFGGLFEGGERDAAATKGDVWDKGRDIRSLRLDMEQESKERSRWINYNTKLAEGAWSMASSAMIAIWGGLAFALMRSEGFSTFWCWCAALAAGGYSWHSAKSFRPTRPAD